MTSVFESFRVALSAMLQNKVRSFLAMLGIIIGILSVVVMLAIANGAARKIESNIAGAATSDLTIWAGAKYGGDFGGRDALTMDDYDAVRNRCSLVASVVPVNGGFHSQRVLFHGKTVAAPPLGVGPGYFDAMHLKVSEGRGLVAADEEFRRAVCVIGSELAKKLGAGPAIVGQDIRLTSWSAERYRVVGVLAPRGTVGWVRLDNCVVVPLETSGDRYKGGVMIYTMYVRLVPGASTLDAASSIARVLRRVKHLGPDQKNNFNITPTIDFSILARQTEEILTVLLSSIGSIALIVGGIGIMNIMLASVSDRTREIGIRKAVGATRMAILAQFLFESVVLCVTGGAVGILGGYGIAKLVSTRIDWPLIVTPFSIGIAFGVSATVGIIFGVSPAWRASRLDPVEALRYE